MLSLRSKTPGRWLEAVLSDFDAFLLDHTACERKAAATGMNFVAAYPSRPALVEPMIEFAREELEHFHLMYRIIARRGLTLMSDYKDPYVNGLLSKVRKQGEPLLLDRLLVAGIIEARSCERLSIVADALPEVDRDLAQTYLDLTRAEARHHALFFRLARQFFGDSEVLERGAELLEYEADLIAELPHRPAVH